MKTNRYFGRILGAWMMVIPFSLMAENAPVAPATPPAGAGSSLNRPQGIQIFDDRVFNLGTDKVAPTSKKSPVSGTDRYLAEEPDYNTEQRDQWIESCSAEREKSTKAFQECYRGQKQKAKRELRNKLDRVEQSQSIPLEQRIPTGESPAGPSGLPGNSNVYRDNESGSLK